MNFKRVFLIVLDSLGINEHNEEGLSPVENIIKIIILLSLI